MRWITNTTTGGERSHPASSRTDYSCRAMRLGPRDQEAQRSQRASFVATFIPEYAASSSQSVSRRIGLGCLVDKNVT